MAYFIFLKNLDNIEGTLYKIAENLNDLNSLKIIEDNYKIIEDNQSNFNNVKYGTKQITKYNNNIIEYIDSAWSFSSKNELLSYVNNLKNVIKLFINNNPSSPVFNIWNSYYNQLNNLNLDTISYPLNKSLEQHFNELGQPALNILQLP
jgi:hypothetical protein